MEGRWGGQRLVCTEGLVNRTSAVLRGPQLAPDSNMFGCFSEDNSKPGVAGGDDAGDIGDTDVSHQGLSSVSTKKWVAKAVWGGGGGGDQ